MLSGRGEGPTWVTGGQTRGPRELWRLILENEHSGNETSAITGTNWSPCFPPETKPTFQLQPKISRAFIIFPGELYVSDCIPTPSEKLPRNHWNARPGITRLSERNFGIPVPTGIRILMELARSSGARNKKQEKTNKNRPWKILKQTSLPVYAGQPCSASKTTRTDYLAHV